MVESASVFCGPSAASASCCGRAEDLPDVVAELKFRDVEWQIFLTDLVERTDHAALDDRPEAFDGLSVDCTNNICS